MKKPAEACDADHSGDGDGSHRARILNAAFQVLMERGYAGAGTLKQAPVKQEPYFGLYVPEACGDVPANVLNPRNTWSDKAAYDETARDLTKRFENNFKKFEGYVGNEVKAAGIHAAA